MTSYMSEGRRLMGRFFRRELDYPTRLDSSDPNFRKCRMCGRDGRMDGIVWCYSCATMAKETRSYLEYGGDLELLHQEYQRKLQELADIG